MAEITLDQIDPLRKSDRAKKRKEKAGSATASDDAALLISKEVETPSRYVCAEVAHEVAHEVHTRNGGEGCEHIDIETGETCESKFQLQLDHVQPWSYGGSNEAENIRLLCAVHNRLAWPQRSGSWVKSYRLAYVCGRVQRRAQIKTRLKG